MPHGALRVGDVEIVALCDGVLTASPIDESFPSVPAEAWPRILAEHPDTVEDGRWRLHFHCFVVRSRGRTILFDTGLGPASAPAYGWSGTEGTLPQELAQAGVGLAHVDRVLISHVHDDHLGWTVTEDGMPRFPNARYVVNAADIDALRNGDVEEVDIFERTVAPLQRAGVLDASHERMRIDDALELVRAAGHTPGHQVLVVDDGDARAILSADATNHPALVEDPSWWGTTDGDPELASRARAELLDLAERDSRIWIPAHFPDPFVRIVTEDGRRRSVAIER